MDCQSDAARANGRGRSTELRWGFRRASSGGLRYAFALTHDLGLAEDVAQEVFVRLHQHLDVAQRDRLLRA